MYVRMYTFVYVWMYVCNYVCMYVCMYACGYEGYIRSGVTPFAFLLEIMNKVSSCVGFEEWRGMCMTGRQRKGRLGTVGYLYRTGGQGWVQT